MMTMHFFGAIPDLEHPLQDTGAGSLHKALVCLDRRDVVARRACAVQAVMMTMGTHWQPCLVR